MKTLSYNLITFSQTFGNAAWTLGHATLGTTNNLDPNGTLTATKLQEDNTNNAHNISQPPTGLIAGSIYTASIYIKPVERAWVRVSLSNFQNVSPFFTAQANFHLSGAGAVGSGIAPLGNVAIAAAPNGYYRITLSGSVGTGSGIPSFLIETLLGDGSSDVFTGTTGSGVLIWGGQCVLGSDPSPYVMTAGSTQPLRDLLRTKQFVMADMYDFTLSSGTRLRYCTSDLSDILWDTSRFLSARNGPMFERQGAKSKVSWKTGLEVGTFEFEIIPKDTDMIEGLTFLLACDAGIFDGAQFVFSRAYFASWTPGALAINPVGVVPLFYGEVCELSFGLSGAKLTVNSHLQRFDMQLPKNLHQPGCDHTLYDTGCTLNKASFTVSGTILSVNDAGNFTSTVTGQNDGYYNLGVVSFTSGVNQGYSKTVKTYTKSAGLFDMGSRFYQAPSPGDTFTVYPGCDKTVETCLNKFNNRDNFGGTPFVPAAETAV